MPENTEAVPEISASPAPQDAKPADTGEKKQKKPRNTSGMKPPLNQLPPEEAFAIRSKGGKAAAKKAPGGEAGKRCPAEPADETSAQEKGRQGPLQGQRRADKL